MSKMPLNGTFSDRRTFLSSLTGPLRPLILALLMCLPCHAATIVLDPGHGGPDEGAGRGTPFPEKQFTLLLGRRIAERLTPEHQVELTRSEDVGRQPDERAAHANHLRADLMVSLHAAVPPYCGKRIAAVYYHADDRLTIPAGVSTPAQSTGSEADRPAWVTLQIRHQKRSRQVADAIRQSLLDSSAFDRVAVHGAPLAPLTGADLPAVLIEVGCMHPTSESSTTALEQEVEEYARLIAEAVRTAIRGASPQ